jgi:hypothetical protein
MAMTRQQWNALQAKLPRAERESYESYLMSIGKVAAPTPSTLAAQESGAIGAASMASQMKTSVAQAESEIATEQSNQTATTVEKNPWDAPPSEAPTGFEWKWIGAKTVGRAGSGSWKLYRISAAPSAGGGVSISGSTGGGNNTGAGGLTQADVDKAIADALAKQNAANQAMIDKMKAEKEAEKLASKQKASDKLKAMFAVYGLESLAPFISDRIMADVSEEMLLLELYDRPEYQQRFPGMKDLRAKKRTITEGEYMKIEKEMTQTARFFDLPVGFYDNPSDFGKLIANEVSAKEYQDRLQVGQDLARSLNPVVKNQLLEFYGVGEGGLTAYVLDPDKALSIIKKQAQAARFVGFGRGAGFQLKGITSGQAENIAGTEAYAKLSEQQLSQAISQAGQLRTTQSRLAGIEGQAYNEEEALKAVIEGSPEALLASQQRAQREAARFGGRSGLTGQSLGSATAI